MSWIVFVAAPHIGLPTSLRQKWLLLLSGFCAFITLPLLSTIANSLYTAVADSSMREAAVITFVVTASGLSLFGIGAAFWGLVAGVIATLVFYKKP